MNMNWVTIKKTMPKLTLTDNVTAMLVAVLCRQSSKFAGLSERMSQIEPNVLKFAQIMRLHWAASYADYEERMKAVSTDTAFIQVTRTIWKYVKYSRPTKRTAILNILNEFIDFLSSPDQEGWTDLRHFVLGSLRIRMAVPSGVDLTYQI